MTKSQVLEEAKKSGMEDATYEALERDFAQFPEELSEENMVAMEAILDEVAGVEKVVAANLNEMADEMDRAADAILDANETYVSEVAEDNLEAINLANDLIGE